MDNVYILSEEFFGDRLYKWLDVRMGNNKLSASLRGLKESKRPLRDLARAMLSDFGYLSTHKISLICAAIDQIDKKNAFEQAKIKADSLCRYGSYSSALRLYHHAERLAVKGEIHVGKYERAFSLHNMAVCLMHLHDVDSAADCMLKAYRLCGKRQMLMEYLYILRLANKTAKLRSFVAQENLGEDYLEQSAAMIRSASRVYDESERNLGLKAGLALKEVPDSPVYSKFVDGYINTQCRRYGLNTHK